MKFTSTTFLFAFVLFITSCNNTENDSNDSIQIDTTIIDSVVSEIDTSSVLPDSLTEAGYIDETEEVANIIEKKYGKQWDFCDCAVKNDSVNKAIENSDNLLDDEFDVLFTRMDEIEMHCKELLTAPSTTPEERDRHKRKIRKCLKNAGK